MLKGKSSECVLMHISQRALGFRVVALFWRPPESMVTICMTPSRPKCSVWCAIQGYLIIFTSGLHTRGRCTQPLEESKEVMLFVTEPVFASLANVLGKYENLPTLPLPIKEVRSPLSPFPSIH